MQAMGEASGASRDRRPDQVPGAAAAPGAAEDISPGLRAAARARGRRVRRATAWAKAKFARSWAGDLSQRLTAVDFMNEAILLAATLLLCAVPFLLIASALAGRSAVTTLSARLGLNHQAATDVGDLFAPSSATSAAVTGTSWLFFILGGIAMATSIQQLYQKVFQVPPRGLRDKLRVVVWLALVVGWTTLGTQEGHSFYADAPVLFWIVNIIAFVGFWWFTMWFLLAGRVAWRKLARCAVLTGLFWIGMLAVFHVIFSSMVISYHQEYGPIGVVFALMSFFIAIGVVIMLGAAAGMLWHDRTERRQAR